MNKGESLVRFVQDGEQKGKAGWPLRFPVPVWMWLPAICVLLWTVPLGTSAQRVNTDKHDLRGARPIVIAHRGASGYRPEHTLAAYELAIDLGADYIEPDLVPSKDAVLVARHENEISGTTDVAARAEFASRKTKKTIDGKTIEGWFTEDFTLAELKSLKAIERMPKVRQHNTIYDGHYQIATFSEILDLVKSKQKTAHRVIGIYPEAKHPSYFAGLKLDPVPPIVEMLKQRGYSTRSSPVYIQCFETAALKQLRKLTKLRLVQLIADDELPYDLVEKKDRRSVTDLLSPAGLLEIATYADGIGPAKSLVLPRDISDRLQKATSLIADAHKAGLVVHPWTFRNENQFLPVEYRSTQTNASAGNYGDAFAEYAQFYSLGVDGVFSENPDTALEAASEFVVRKSAK